MDTAAAAATVITSPPSIPIDEDEVTVRTLKGEIRSVICANVVTHFPEDMLLNKLNTSVITTAYAYNILPQRIGRAWEKAATFFGFKQTPHIDLIHEERKIAVELKNSAKSDSSAARRQKYKMLLDYKKKHPSFQVVYAVINDKTAKDKMVHDNTIRYVSSTHALSLIFDKNCDRVVKVMSQVVEEYLSKTTKLSKTECHD